MKKIIFFMLLLIGLPVHAKEAMTGSITIHSAEEDAVYSIRNVSSGEEVFKGRLDKDKVITVSGLPEGTYKIVGENISSDDISIPMLMTMFEADDLGYDTRILNDSEKIQPWSRSFFLIWDLHYKVTGEHIELTSIKSDSDSEHTSAIAAPLAAVLSLILLVLLVMYAGDNIHPLAVISLLLLFSLSICSMLLA